MKNYKFGFHLLVKLIKLILNTLQILKNNGVPTNVSMSSNNKLIPFPKCGLKPPDNGRLSELYPVYLFLVDFIAVVILTRLHKKYFHALV